MIHGYYGKLALATVIAVYFLILVGGIVRSTGSGMGCPDWPKCFGQVIPPTSVDQLPENYKDVYAEMRHKKNLRFASLIERFGFNEAADYLRTEEALLEEADFNALKTWIEYINRLIGVVIGFLILALFLFSLKYIKTKIAVFIWSAAALVMVIFQAWIGSIVVSTNLTPWMISVHMILAIFIVFMLIHIYNLSKPVGEFIIRAEAVKTVKFVIIAGISMMLVQILIGTQVRESVDVVATQLGADNRNLWIDSLGFNFYVHRSFSLLILVTHAYLVWFLHKQDKTNQYVRKLFLACLILVILEIISGAGMAYFSIPAFLQPIHLLIGTLIVGLQFYIMLILPSTKNKRAYTVA